MVVTDGSGDQVTTYQVPMTYRAGERAGAGGVLIGTSEHGVLGRRWIYDGTRDPVLVAQLVALLQGTAEPQAQSVSNTPDPAVIVQLAGDSSLTVTGPVVAADGPSATDLRVETASAGGTRRGQLTVRVNRILRPAGGTTRRVFPPPGGFPTARRSAASSPPRTTPPCQARDRDQRDRPTGSAAHIRRAHIRRAHIRRAHIRPAHRRTADPPRAAGCPRPAASGGHDRSLRDVPPGRRGPARRLGDQLERQPADRDARARSRHGGFDDQTVRDIIFPSVGGDVIRLELTNVFGSSPLRIGHVTVAVAALGAEVVPGTIHPVTFGGSASVRIPAGAQVLSDPVGMQVRALQDLAVSVYLPGRTGRATYHADAQQVNWVSRPATTPPRRGRVRLLPRPSPGTTSAASW